MKIVVAILAESFSKLKMSRVEEGVGKLRSNENKSMIQGQRNSKTS